MPVLFRARLQITDQWTEWALYSYISVTGALWSLQKAQRHLYQIKLGET